MIARAIHQVSRRNASPLIRVNCAAIPTELFESEFFRHIRGAFTGAVRDRVGRFELADGGTLFLDEIGEIPLELQSKLLRVLQEGQFERGGEERTHKVDVRIIAATNRDLPLEVAAKRFREDLYFRLNVFPIQSPALRDRPMDIAPLAAHFLKQTAKRLNMPGYQARIASRQGDDQEGRCGWRTPPALKKPTAPSSTNPVANLRRSPLASDSRLTTTMLVVPQM